MFTPLESPVDCYGDESRKTFAFLLGELITQIMRVNVGADVSVGPNEGGHRGPPLQSASGRIYTK